MGHGKSKSVDLRFRLLAVDYLSEQLLCLEKQLSGVGVSDDIEFVHQARVSSRRLRVALQIFKRCFKGKDVKVWLKELRSLTKGLGEARDKDVQIEFLEGHIHSVVDSKTVAGLGDLLLRLRGQREFLEPGVVKAAKRLRQSGVLCEMEKVLVRKNVEAVDSSRALKITGKQLKKRLGALLAFLPGLEDEKKLHEHHQLRIAAKKLRYSMEIVGSLYEEGLREEIKTVKKLQTLLGGVHDCDFWLEELAGFLPGDAGVVALRLDREGERRKLFLQAQTFCGRLEKTRYWQGFKKRL